jgi:hypothetical protein
MGFPAADTPGLNNPDSLLLNEGDKTMKKTIGMCLVLFSLALLGGGCAPEVGSEAWCKQMNEKPKGDWSANEAADYAKHCVF